MTWLLGAGGTFAAAALLLLWPVRGLELLDTSPANARAPLGTALMGVAVVLLAGAGAATAAALVVRLRRARGVERQQLKWLTYAGALTVVGGLLILVPKVAGIGHLPGPLEVAGTVLTAGGVLGIPIAAGVAILRYRLYDIDRIIHRTLVYGLLTAALGLGGAGVVVTLGQLFGGVSGDLPSWAVAGSTLAAAALVRPARRRLQEAVDRRFNRRRHDAARTVEAFSARLRHEIDLDNLTLELLAVVDRTMEPTSVSLWLRPPAGTMQAADRALTGGAATADGLPTTQGL